MVYALDPAVVVAAHPKDLAALGSRAFARMDIWMTFWMALAANTKARATDSTYLGGRTGDGRHSTYLCSLPRMLRIHCRCWTRSRWRCWGGAC